MYTYMYKQRDTYSAIYVRLDHSCCKSCNLIGLSKINVIKHLQGFYIVFDITPTS